MAKTLLQAWLDVTLGELDENVADDPRSGETVLTLHPRSEVGHGLGQYASDFGPSKGLVSDKGIKK
jgi:hypothetical protein